MVGMDGEVDDHGLQLKPLETCHDMESANYDSRDYS